MRVLLIDDDELSRELLELLLAEEGHEVASAAAGTPAVEILRDARYRADVVLTDMQMAGLSGAELAKELRAASEPRTKLLAMSGSHPADDLLAAYDGFLLKPFTMEEFDQAVRNHSGRVDFPKAETKLGDSEPSGDVLHGATFDGFAAMMRPEQMQELYALCLRDSAKQRAVMDVALFASDDQAFRRAAHTMKGSFGMLGARELQRICAQMEASGIIRDAHVRTLAEFGPAIARLRRMLRARGIDVVDDGK